MSHRRSVATCRPLAPTLSREGRGGVGSLPLSPRGRGRGPARSDGRVRGRRGPPGGEDAGMKTDKAINIEDLRRMAKRRLPRLCFDFIEGGLEDELGLARNERAFDRHQLVPRYLVDVAQCDQRANLSAPFYAQPFGIAPTALPRLLPPSPHFMPSSSPPSPP